MPRSQQKNIINKSQGVMSPSEFSYPNTADCKCSDRADTLVRHLETKYMKMEMVFKDEVNKFLNENM